MGHDLDQVIRATPGALSSLKRQRENLDRQIQALETLLVAHDALVLEYKVDEKGNVTDVTPVDPGPPPVADIEEKRTKREQVLEIMDTIGGPMKVEDILQFIEMEPTSLRATLSALRKAGKIDRVERGAYQVVEDAVNG